MRTILYALVLWATLAHGTETSASRAERKRAFLQGKVFTTNRPLSEKLAGAQKIMKAMDLEKTLSASGREPKSERARPVVAPASVSTTGSSIGLPSGTGVSPSGLCGSSGYLKTYCFHRIDSEHWLICSPKWGRCTTRN